MPFTNSGKYASDVVIARLRNAFQVEILFAASWMIALISFAESTSPHSLRSSFPLVLLRFQNVSCRSVSVGFSEKTSVFGSV